jgi:hypothetical protein
VSAFLPLPGFNSRVEAGGQGWQNPQPLTVGKLFNFSETLPGLVV